MFELLSWIYNVLLFVTPFALLYLWGEHRALERRVDQAEAGREKLRFQIRMLENRLESLERKTKKE